MENLVKKIKPNFKTLGKKYGKQMKEIAAAMISFSNHEIGEIERNGKFTRIANRRCGTHARRR